MTQRAHANRFTFPLTSQTLFGALVCVVCMASGMSSVVASELDTLRPFDRRSASIFYREPTIVAQAARFDLRSPAYLHELVVWLGGDATTGSARVTVYSNEGGLPAPLLSQPIGRSYIIEKSRSGIERVVVKIDEVFLDQPQFFVVVEDLSVGVVLVSDQTRKVSQCEQDGQRWMYQAIRRRDGRWYNGRYGYAIEARVEYPAVTPPTYLVDVTTAVGLPDTAAANRSIAWGDVDSDGWQDLIVGGRFYMNRDGARFEDVTDRQGLRRDDIAAAHVFIDVDNDRDLDLLVLAGTGGDVARGALFVNDGRGAFTFRQLEAEFPTRPLSIAIADANHDDHLDLYVVGTGSTGTAPPAGRLYLNNGALDVVDGGAIIPKISSIVGAQWFDVDGDGDVDLSLTGQPPAASNLFVNDGSGRYEFRLPESTATAEPVTTRSPGDWGDADGDGTVDQLQPADIPTSELKQVAGEKGISADELLPVPSSLLGAVNYRHWSGGGTWADVDNDGRLDALITSSCACRYATLMMQDATGRFADRSFEYGLFRVPAGADAVWVDFDNDGKLDLATFLAGRFALYRNTNHHAGRSLEVDLAGSPNPARAIGATVIVSGPSGTQSRHVGSGRGWLVQAPAVAHFGLGGGHVDSASFSLAGAGALSTPFVPASSIHRIFAPSFRVDGDVLARSELSLQVAPNPFTSRLRFTYELQFPMRVRIELFAADGRLVALHLDSEQQAGAQQSEWTPVDEAGRRLPTGTYIYRVSFGTRSLTGRVLLVD